eukprot:TRINITY_DN10745_c0_g1_i1.p1 TRINITY_DN10745_c0_g1~~TRINITY_DN10745_c0_g1_i1.p1  ORF type:complete len:355 (-),score=72.39 TRINITY_DN10745_c0_g1_i1:268-1332(-)
MNLEIDSTFKRVQRRIEALGRQLRPSSIAVSDGDGKPRAGVALPRTKVVTQIFSTVTEKPYDKVDILQPTKNLVELPQGEPPSLAEIYGSEDALPPGHVCIVGPTGSGKSTIVRNILCALLQKRTLSVYTMEFPVEVSLTTHGLSDVCQIDMLQTLNGKQRTLAETANALLKHDPDLIYFGELRTRSDFETATSTALSGVAVISTGHAHSPLDLLERMRNMNIDLSTQFRAFRTVIGVKRVPILCNKCKIRVLVTNLLHARAMRLMTMYMAVSLSRFERRKDRPTVFMPPPAGSVKCDCNGGYTHYHTIFEFLHIDENDTMESLRARHTYSTEETLISLIMQGKVNPLYLENFV